jgi:hypothetical protein
MPIERRLWVLKMKEVPSSACAQTSKNSSSRIRNSHDQAPVRNSTSREGPWASVVTAAVVRAQVSGWGWRENGARQRRAPSRCSCVYSL